MLYGIESRIAINHTWYTVQWYELYPTTLQIYFIGVYDDICR